MPASINSAVLSAVAVPVVNTAQYAAGDAMGGKLTLNSAVRVKGGSASIKKVLLHCKSSQTFDFDVVFFRADPADTTVTNNAAFDVNAADFTKAIGFAKAVAANWCDVGTPSFAAIDVDIPFDLPDGSFSLYAVIICRGTPTLVSTSDLSLEVLTIPD